MAEMSLPEWVASEQWMVLISDHPLFQARLNSTDCGGGGVVERPIRKEAR